MTGRTKHGLSTHPLYKLWLNVKDRCGNPNNPYFHNYGGRGIRLHPAWVASFPAFLEAVGPRPSGAHTLERKENDGNYEPGNVCWATKKEQARNQRKNRLLTLGGRTMPLAAWAEEMGLAPSTLHYRLSPRGGLTMEQALTLPRRQGKRPHQAA
jgi:hypothetical protein